MLKALKTMQVEMEAMILDQISQSEKFLMTGMVPPPPADVLYCVNNCFSLKKKKKKELLFTIVGIVLLSDFGVASG